MRKKDSIDSHSGSGGWERRQGSGAGYRSGRLARRQRSRQRRARMILTAGLAAAALLFVVVSLLVRGCGKEEVQAGAPVTGGAIVATGRGPDGALSQVLVLLPAGQEGYHVFTALPRTVAEIPGQGFMRFDEALATGGQPLLDEALAGLFGTAISGHIDFDREALGALAAPASTIELNLEQPWESADGSLTLAAGENQVPVDEALDILAAAASDGIAGPGLQALFYQGLGDAMARVPEAERQAAAAAFAGKAKSDDGAGDAAALAGVLGGWKGLAGIEALPVTLVGGDSWYLEPVPAQLKALTGTAEAGAVVEVRNGTTAAGAAEAAARQLETLGFEVMVTPGTSEVEFAHSQIRCGSEALRQGGQVREALGRGTIIKDDNLEKNAITVIIGRDLVNTGG